MGADGGGPNGAKSRSMLSGNGHDKAKAPTLRPPSSAKDSSRGTFARSGVRAGSEEFRQCQKQSRVLADRQHHPGF
jgi:hypothetical protein